jgi:hypothetical protein
MTEQDWSEQDWQNLIDAARSLMARVDGDVELARGLWQDAFTEAERIEHNLLCELESEMQEDGERAVLDQIKRFDQALDARRQFRVVDNKDDN